MPARRHDHDEAPFPVRPPRQSTRRHSEPERPLPQVEAKKPARSAAEPRGQARAVDLPAARGVEAVAAASLNLETSTQALGEEAINLLFEKHRLNRIA